MVVLPYMVCLKSSLVWIVYFHRVRVRLGYPTPESWMLGTNKVWYTINMIFE
jgi:hypothetical protein